MPGFVQLFGGKVFGDPRFDHGVLPLVLQSWQQLVLKTGHELITHHQGNQQCPQRDGFFVQKGSTHQSHVPIDELKQKDFKYQGLQQQKRKKKKKHAKTT